MVEPVLLELMELVLVELEEPVLVELEVGQPVVELLVEQPVGGGAVGGQSGVGNRVAPGAAAAAAASQAHRTRRWRPA